MDAAAIHVIDGLNVHIENGRIVALVDAAGDPSNRPTIDAAGQYLVPGLIDVHTHLQAPFEAYSLHSISCF